MSTTALQTTSPAISPLSVDQLKIALAEESEKRKLLNDYITGNLKEGIDFDKTHSQSKKPSLMKPGSEKICSLLNLEVRFEADTETLNMLSEQTRGKIVAYKCILVSRVTGQQVAEGRGAYEMGEKNADISRNLNTSIKMAQKRAQVDATLRLAALSDRFTQDEAPEVKAGVDQTDEVLDALRKCDSLKAYRNIIGNINQRRYKLNPQAIKTIMEFARKVKERLMMEDKTGTLAETPDLKVDDQGCTCPKNSKEPCAYCKKEILAIEKKEAATAK